jgi:hypothetical protein
VSGSNLFVTNYGTGTIGEFSTSGATVNAALITGLNAPSGIAVSGSSLAIAKTLGMTGRKEQVQHAVAVFMAVSFFSRIGADVWQGPALRESAVVSAQVRVKLC